MREYFPSNSSPSNDIKYNNNMSWDLPVLPLHCRVWPTLQESDTLQITFIHSHCTPLECTTRPGQNWFHTLDNHHKISPHATKTTDTRMCVLASFLCPAQLFITCSMALLSFPSLAVWSVLQAMRAGWEPGNKTSYAYNAHQIPSCVVQVDHFNSAETDANTLTLLLQLPAHQPEPQRTRWDQHPPPRWPPALAWYCWRLRELS